MVTVALAWLAVGVDWFSKKIFCCMCVALRGLEVCVSDRGSGASVYFVVVFCKPDGPRGGRESELHSRRSWTLALNEERVPLGCLGQGLQLPLFNNFSQTWCHSGSSRQSAFLFEPLRPSARSQSYPAGSPAGTANNSLFPILNFPLVSS